MPRAAAAADHPSRCEAVGHVLVGIPSPRASRAFCCPTVHRALDVAVIAAYCAAVVVFGLVLSGRQRDARDYFLGHRGLPWWAIMLSIVATETSALTVISFPGIAARTNLVWLQVTFGYLVGRIGVAAFLLPGYFEGTQDTAYERPERPTRGRNAPRRRRERLRARLGPGEARGARLPPLVQDPLHLLGRPRRRRADRGRITWHGSPDRSTVARRPWPEGRAAGAHWVWNIHHLPNRAVPGGGHEPVACRSGRSQNARRRDLPHVRDQPTPPRTRGPRGRWDSGGRDEQPRVRGQFARLGVHP